MRVNKIGKGVDDLRTSKKTSEVCDLTQFKYKKARIIADYVAFVALFCGVSSTFLVFGFMNDKVLLGMGMALCIAGVVVLFLLKNYFMERVKQEDREIPTIIGIIAAVFEVMSGIPVFLGLFLAVVAIFIMIHILLNAGFFLWLSDLR